jgi:hypothetical protein
MGIVELLCLVAAVIYFFGEDLVSWRRVWRAHRRKESATAEKSG